MVIIFRPKTDLKKKAAQDKKKNGGEDLDQDENYTCLYDNKFVKWREGVHLKMISGISKESLNNFIIHGLRFPYPTMDQK